MVRKVRHIFVICDGVLKEHVLDANTDSCTISLIADFHANVVGTSLQSILEHILENLTFRWIYWYSLFPYSF